MVVKPTPVMTATDLAESPTETSRLATAHQVPAKCPHYLFLSVLPAEGDLSVKIVFEKARIPSIY